MKKPAFFPMYGYFPFQLLLVIFMVLANQPAAAQSCPLNSTVSINSSPNTYYTGKQGHVIAGTKSFAIAAATSGTTPISAGDIVLIIQMQGAQINSNNSSSYGDGTGIGRGYLTNSALLAGTMEYLVAANSVPLTGGTLNVTTALVHSYQLTSYGTDGQYTYQVIRIPVYYDVQLTGTITPPRWDGNTGGVVVIFASDNINLNSQTIDASGMGFRGGGGRSLSGGTGVYTDYATQSSAGTNASKGEGIAGTPKYLNNNGSLLKGGSEGYPGGSFAQGAPGNAGGGGTDGDPANNDENTGGAGGGNGGLGGNGGNSWNSDLASGGARGAIFAQASASRLVMGGGGGAGTSNNGTGTPNNGLASSGTAGGGIIILTAGTAITGTGTIKSNGTDGNNTVQNDGAGGAGAGGSILIYSNNGVASNITAQANGGAGGTNEAGGGPSHGPGGGGGGGVIYSNASLNAASSVYGGVAGTTAGATTSYGATTGTAGIMVTNMRGTDMATFPLNCFILATNFINVKAVPADNVVNIDWNVNGAADISGFVVERSVDGINFSAIGSVPAQSNLDNYQYADNSASTAGGNIYYRILESQSGGQTIYSKILFVQFNVTESELAVYPNPASSFITVNFSMANPEAISLTLFDMKGTQLWKTNYRAAAGQNTLKIDMIGSLPEGIYLLQWFDGLKPRLVKVLVHH